MLNRGKFNFVAPLVVLVLFGGLAVETLSRPRAADAEPYHQRIVEAARQLPTVVGDWTGSDIKAQQAAIDLLHPNVIYNRQYINRATGETVSVLLVHCKDARDLYGHYPPICYPAHGMPQQAANPAHWKVDGVDIEGVEYEFGSQEFRNRVLLVYNFLILPPKVEDGKSEPGRIARDMDQVGRNAWNYLRRFYGAAQVQVVFGNAAIPPERRQEIFDQMIAAHLPVIEAIRSGAIQ